MLHWSQPSIVCQQWLRNYQNDHRHPTNHLIHCLGIPLIFISLTSLVNTINFGGYGLGDLALIGLGIFYLIHDTKAAAALAPFMFLSSWISSQIGWIYLGSIFILSWTIQVIGHRVYDKNNPSTYKSLIYLLVAPLYLINPWIRVHQTESKY